MFAYGLALACVVADSRKIIVRANSTNHDIILCLVAGAILFFVRKWRFDMKSKSLCPLRRRTPAGGIAFYQR